MKKIFLVLLLGFLFSANTFAETKLIDKFHLKTKSGKDNIFSVYTLCIDGYKFITTQDYVYTGSSSSNAISTSVSSIQFMIVENGVMVPAKCN